jgi:hypothetical protein
MSCSATVPSRQRKDIVNFERCLLTIDNYWSAVGRRYIALFCVLVFWNVWNMYDLFHRIFLNNFEGGQVNSYIVSHTILGGTALFGFWRSKASERLTRSSVHYNRLNHGLRLLNLYRNESDSKLYQAQL